MKRGALWEVNLVKKIGVSTEHKIRDIDEGDQEHGSVGIFRNITGSSVHGEKVCENLPKLPLLNNADYFDETNHTKAETNNISIIWHELISPLTVIKGYTATLLQLNGIISEKDKEQYLKSIDSASNRAIRLLENLRDITKIEESDSLELQRISLVDLMQPVVSDIQNQNPKHIFKIFSSTRLPLIKADPEKIEMVINNLLINAVKYSPQGGDIEVEMRLVRNEHEFSKLFEDAPLVKVPCMITSVSDTGIGVPDAELGHIFQKFYRVKNNVSRTIPGAGLGLYICKVIVEAHGGRIWARNRLQTGSVFHFSLTVE
jgi:signal transduction histidine kinase